MTSSAAMATSVASMPDAATVQEFFFVPSLPGAPVQMQIFEGEAMVFELEQTARLRPDSN